MWLIWKDPNAEVFGSEIISACVVANMALTLEKERIAVFAETAKEDLGKVDFLHAQMICWKKSPVRS